MSAHRRPVRVYNDEDEAVPPYGVAIQTGAGDEELVKVGKVDKSGRTDVLVNGPTPIPPKSEGMMFEGFPAFVQTANAPNAAQSGEVWGSKAGSWFIESTSTGFSISTDADANGVALVALMTGSYVTFVEVTTAAGSGTEFSDGIEKLTDAGTDQFTDGAACKIRDVNGDALEAGVIYEARFIGNRNRVPTYYTTSVAAGGSGTRSPLAPLCIETGLYGAVTAIRQIWVNADDSADCLPAEACDCDDNGQARGMVTWAADGVGIDARTVKVTTSPGGVDTASDDSNPLGYYSIDDVPAGAYTVTLVDVLVGETVEYQIDGGAWASGATTTAITVVAGEAHVVNFRVTV